MRLLRNGILADDSTSSTPGKPPGTSPRADAAPGNRRASCGHPTHPNLIEAEITLRTTTAGRSTRSGATPGCGPSADGGRFLLNGRPWYLRLVLEQGYWPSRTSPRRATTRCGVKWS